MDTTQVSNTSSNSENKIIQYSFYKNPIFILFSVYTLFIFFSYAYMNDKIKNSYVFSNKFRDSNNNIYFSEILTYPYNLETVPSIIKVLFGSPIILYVVFFSLLFNQFVDINNDKNLPYYYSIMFSYLYLLILFIIHLIVIKYIVGPKDINITSDLKRIDGKDNEKTYESLYRTQWVILIFLSPIFVTVLIFLERLLNNI
jgi:hypothetical protein